MTSEKEAPIISPLQRHECQQLYTHQVPFTRAVDARPLPVDGVSGLAIFLPLETDLAHSTAFYRPDVHPQILNKT